MSDAGALTVVLLDREYRVACAPDEQEQLLSAARYLNDHMREIRDHGKVVGMERIAVMAALNVAHELLQLRTAKDDQLRAFAGRIRTLNERIERALNQNAQIDL